MKKALTGLVAAGLAAMTLAAEPAKPLQPPRETEAQKAVRLAWWRDARYGMFIHWGVYSALAGSWNGKPDPDACGEWIMRRMKIPVAEYMKAAKDFNPVKYDPEAWVDLAQKAGMKYIVITAKHHDGFALFDTKASDWDVVDATPWKKDVLKPLVDAAHKRGMRIGFYYSQYQDWHHPGGGVKHYGASWDKAQDGDFDKYLHDVAIPQVRELLTNYGKIDVFWWDTPGNITPAQAAPLFCLVHALQPGIVTNDRLGGGFPGDSGTPEQFVPANAGARDFEVCMTLNDTWGYKAQDHNWKSAEAVIKKLCDIASKGGNYLLNMGPRADGTIPQEITDTFLQVGAWLRVNGESVYGTTASPFEQRFAWGRCTKRFTPDGTMLYLQVFDWPKDGRLLLPGLHNKIDRARILGGADGLVESSDAGMTVVFPGKKPGNLARPEVVAVKTFGTLDITPPVAAPTLDLAAKPAALDLARTETSGDVKLELGEGTPFVGFCPWSKGALGWSFKLAKAGKVALSAAVACENSAGTKAEILVDGAVKAAMAVPATGGATTFKKAPLGVFDLPAGKTVKLEIRPVASPWIPFNLHDVELESVH